MEILIERCCGLDVHKKNITACIVTLEGKEIKTFKTHTAELLTLIEWIQEKCCTHVAMESTGVYWKPIMNLLEVKDITVLVVNAQHMKAVPGRKTDVKDAEWIANLLRHGLLTPSYIPDRSQREVRELVRYRRSLIDERAREYNRVQKVLEGANIKLSSVISDVMGKSGRDMLEAMIQGEEDPAILSEFAQRRMKQKKEELKTALQGTMQSHQRLMLKTMLAHTDFLDEQIIELDTEVAKRLGPFLKDLERLDGIPGVGMRTAEQILAEVGTDMSRFPSAGHLCSWAGLVPGHNESAGKRKPSKTRKGNKHLRSALAEAANAVCRSDNYLGSQYRRISGRRGKQRAAIAVGHSILTIVYHVLKDPEQTYKELGSDYFDKRKQEMLVKQSVKKLESLGYAVTLSTVS